MVCHVEILGNLEERVIQAGIRRVLKAADNACVDCGVNLAHGKRCGSRAHHLEGVNIQRGLRNTDLHAGNVVHAVERLCGVHVAECHYIVSKVLNLSHIQELLGCILAGFSLKYLLNLIVILVHVRQNRRAHLRNRVYIKLNRDNRHVQGARRKRLQVLGLASQSGAFIYIDFDLTAGKLSHGVREVMCHICKGAS